MNWRKAYQENVESELEHLARLRDFGVDMHIDGEHGERPRLSESTPEDRLHHARIEAEKAVNEAIHRWNETHD